MDGIQTTHSQSCIATSRGFQFIKEIKDNFRQWDLIDDIDPIFVDVVHGHKIPRLRWANSMTAPTNSCGTMICAFT